MKKFLIVLLIVLALGLAVYIAWPLLTPQTATTAEETASDPETTESTPEEVWAAGADETLESLPEQELPAGEPVVLNGKILETVRTAGADYARADEIAAALGLEFTGDSTAAMFHGDHEAAFYALDNYVQWDGRNFELPNSPISYKEYFYLPVQQLAENLYYNFYRDSETNQLYLTPGAGGWAISQTRRVPVLAYHAISDDIWGLPEMFLSPAVMEEQLAYLVDNGYDPIWFEDLAHLEDYDKPVILTFDDGYDDNYTELFPLLKKYQVKATIFVIGLSFESEHKLTREQIKEMADSGLVSIQSHGMTHKKMAEMTEEELEYEMGESCRILTALTGKKPYAVSYPNGAVSEMTLQVAQKYYRFGVRTNNEPYWTDEYGMLVRRFNVGPEDDMDSFAAKLTDAGAVREEN